MTMSDKGKGQEHFKANYIEVIKRIVPEYYDETEYNLFGAEEDLQYRVLGSILYLANNVSSLIGKPTTYNLQVSSFSSNEAYVPYFVPFNNLTDVSPSLYEQYILRPFGKSFASFTNKEQFSNFLITSALPHTRFNHVSDYFAQQFSSTVDPNITTVSGVSNALIENLGWVYFQNTAGRITDPDSVAVSSFLHSSLIDNIYYGKRVSTSDGVKNLFKWMYHNAKGGHTAWTPIVNKFLPVPFNNVSSVYNPANGDPGNLYASGGQLVSALDTLVDVWVNEDDPNSLYFRDIVNASLLGLDVSRMENAGPMSKMLKALAYGFYDIQTSIRDIQYLLDIEQCPEEFLQYLGRYLGWTFFSEEPDKWRDQLKQAIYLYKAKGTRQAISQAVNMVIPSSVYSPVSPVSGLQELWESYIPNLIYYTLKTETRLGKDNEEYLRFRSKFSEALAASGIPFRVTNYDTANKDNNVRFAVDAVLQLLDNRNGYLQIAGTHYKQTAFWKAQLATGAAPGYTARGARLTIPPWEENRFYQNCQVGPNMDDFLRDVSSILSKPYAEAGCGVPVSASVNIAKYISSSVSIKDVNGITEPGWGANNTFKFMTSSLNLPLNYQQVIREGDLESMSVFDYWNSKSSEVHSKFHASSIDFSSLGYTNLTQTKMGRKGLPTIVNIFRQFSPFHTLNKLFVGSGVEDYYYRTRHDGGALPDSPNPGYAWSGVQNVQIQNTIQSDMDQAMSTTEASTFPGAWAAGGSFSGVGVSPSIWNPKGGRFLPSATLHGTRGTSPQGYFWSGGESVGVKDFKTGRKEVPAARTAGRRRDLKYKFIGWAQNRQGLNQPISTDWFGMSGGALQPVLKGRGLNIPGFAPKGFNFSSQNFVDTSGSLSSVYSYYNSSATPFFEFSASEFFPARSIPDFEPNASSFNQLRDVFGSQILRAMTTIFIKRGKEDKRWLRFTDQGFENFRFGKGIQELFNVYNTLFRRHLSCWVDQETQVEGDRFAGGFNIIAHVFGPGLFNHNFSIRGDIQKNLHTKAFPGIFGGSISSLHPDWSGVVTTPSVEQNNMYLNTQGNLVELTDGILDAGAHGSYVNYLDIFETPADTFQSNKTLLSGIEFVSSKVNSIVVWNNPSNPLYNIDKISASGITFLQRTPTSDPLRTVRARFPLNGNLNYSYNGNFKFPPKDVTRTTSKSLSAIAGWALQSQYRTPVINQDGDQTNASNPQCWLVDAEGSGMPYVELRGVGGTSGTGIVGVMSGVLGLAQTPNLATVTSFGERMTPANLRPLTPADSYQISFDASNGHASIDNAKITYALHNETNQKQWVQPTGEWRDMAANFSANLVNVLASSTSLPDGWNHYTGIITPSSTFLQGDNYQLTISPGRKTKDITSSWRVRDISIKNYEQGTNKITAGRQGNKLFPNEQYLLGVDARVARIAQATSQSDEILYIRIVTDPKPYVGSGWTSFTKNWCYDWHAKSWADARTMPLENQWHKLTFPGDSLEPTRYVTEFNTLNSRTPLKYHSLSEYGPFGGYFASAGPVHNDETVYYVEVGKPEPTGEFNGLTLLGVDIVNKRYNIYGKSYSKKDFIDIFDFFDDLGINKSSRDARDSSGTYLLSGGSRSEYLEYWGGSHSAVDSSISYRGVYGFKENE